MTYWPTFFKPDSLYDLSDGFGGSYMLPFFSVGVRRLVWVSYRSSLLHRRYVLEEAALMEVSISPDTFIPLKSTSYLDLLRWPLGFNTSRRLSRLRDTSCDNEFSDTGFLKSMEAASSVPRRNLQRELLCCLLVCCLKGSVLFYSGIRERHHILTDWKGLRLFNWFGGFWSVLDERYPWTKPAQRSGGR